MHFFTMPEYWTDLKEAFKKGKNSIQIHDWNWCELLLENTELLQNKIHKTKQVLTIKNIHKKS